MSFNLNTKINNLQRQVDNLISTTIAQNTVSNTNSVIVDTNIQTLLTCPVTTTVPTTINASGQLMLTTTTTQSVNALVFLYISTNNSGYTQFGITQQVTVPPNVGAIFQLNTTGTTANIPAGLTNIILAVASNITIVVGTVEVDNYQLIVNAIPD